jgi:multidrug efflux system membrane fusion protein
MPHQGLSLPKRSSPVKRLGWLWFVGLVLAAAAGYFAYRHYGLAAKLQSNPTATNASQPKRVALTPVLARPAQRGNLPIYLDGVGTAQALNTVTIHSRVDGELVKVAFEEGQFVHKDDLIVEIDPRAFQVQKAQAEGQKAQAEGQKAQATAQLAQARGQLAQANGQLGQAQGQRAKDQAALDNAQRDLERYQIAKEAVPRQQLDTAQTQVDQSKAAIAIDDASNKGAQATIEVANAAIKSADATNQVAEAAMKVADAAIQNAELMLTYTKITAPIDGRMGLRNVDAGNIVHASDPNGLAVITQVQPIAVVFTLAQGALPQVQKAMSQPAKVEALAYDTTLKKLLAKGTLAALDNQIDLSSGTFKLKAIFDNQDSALFPNQMVNVRLLVDTLKEVVLVPAEAVQRSPQSTFVDVIKDDNTVDQRDVTIGPTEAGLTVVEQGLSDGEMIATSGLDRLQPGASVIIQTAEASRAGRGNATRSGGTQPATRGRGGMNRGSDGGRGPASASSATGVGGAGGNEGAGGGNP